MSLRKVIVVHLMVHRLHSLYLQWKQEVCVCVCVLGVGITNPLRCISIIVFTYYKKGGKKSPESPELWWRPSSPTGSIAWEMRGGRYRWWWGRGQLNTENWSNTISPSWWYTPNAFPAQSRADGADCGDGATWKLALFINDASLNDKLTPQIGLYIFDNGQSKAHHAKQIYKKGIIWLSRVEVIISRLEAEVSWFW